MVEVGEEIRWIQYGLLEPTFIQLSMRTSDLLPRMMNILRQSVSIYVVIQAKLFYSNFPFLLGKNSSVREQENNNRTRHDFAGTQIRQGG